MTLKNRIDNRELLRLEGDSQGRDELLLRMFGDDQKGLTQERLESIRSFKGSLYKSVYLAAQVLFESLLEFGIPPADIHAQFTVDNLAALVYEEWTNVRWDREALRKAMRGKHRLELELRIRQFNFRDLTYPQLFRETVSFEGIPLYQGNLYEARAFWRKFQPSNEDFLNNVSLPLKINAFEALLLGIYWTDGYLRKSSGSLTLRLEGEQSDLNAANSINFYDELVVPLLKSLHNYGPLSSDDYIKSRMTRSGGIEYHPSFKINSAAICTWLRDDLCFPPPQRTKGIYESKRIPFRYINSLEARRGFLGGVLAGLGIVNGDSILFEHRDKEFIEDIAELCKMLSYTPSQIAHRHYTESHRYHTIYPIWYFKLFKEDVDGIQKTDLDTNLPHRGLFFNPKHYRKFLDHVIQL